MMRKGALNKVSSPPEMIKKGAINKLVQLFWGCFFDYGFHFETTSFDQFLFQKLYDLDRL